MSILANLMRIRETAATLLARSINPDGVVPSEAAGAGVSKNIVPSLANEIAVTGGAGAWQEGAYAQIIGDSGAAPIVVDGIVVTSATGVHDVSIAVGAGGAEVDKDKIHISGVGYYPVRGAVIPANSRISSKTASKAGGGQAIGIKLVFHNVNISS